MTLQVYPDGSLSWVREVPCAPRSGKEPYKAIGLNGDAETVMVCFLNEARVHYARYEILHYNITSYHDDGPPSLSQIIESCRIIEESLKLGKKVVVFCPKDEKKHEAFSALCTAAHAVLFRSATAQEAGALWSEQKALEIGRDRGWIDAKAFDSERFRRRWTQHDTSWLIPGEIQIMADPMSTVVDPDPATSSHLSADTGGASEVCSFAALFAADNVKLLVRLNLTKEPGLKESYDPASFTKLGIEHIDCGYDDLNGGLPTPALLDNVIKKFMALETGQAAAFHCKGGFGRSGICAALCAVVKHDIPGDMVAALMRLCRPGSLTTPQQADLLKRMAGRESVEEFIRKGLSSQACCRIA